MGAVTPTTPGPSDSSAPVCRGRSGYAGPFKLNDGTRSSTSAMLTVSRSVPGFATGRARPGGLRPAQLSGSGYVGRQRDGFGRADEDTTGKVVNTAIGLEEGPPGWARRTVMAMDDGHAFAAPWAATSLTPFGLRPMLGNVWEFCGTRSARTEGSESRSGDLDPKRGFAVRGGGWSNMAADALCPPPTRRTSATATSARVAIRSPRSPGCNLPGLDSAPPDYPICPAKKRS
jgi:hypothetical protein